MDILKNNKINFNKENLKQNLISFFVVLIVFALDRFTKIKIIEHQTDNFKIYINEFINLDLIWNTGIGFGLLSTSSSIIYNSTSILILAIVIFLISIIIKSNFTEKILFSLIVGGAIGNLFDRATYFAVPDFIDVHYQNYHWFTFNIADIFITLGISMIIIKDLILKR